MYVKSRKGHAISCKLTKIHLCLATKSRVYSKDIFSSKITMVSHNSDAISKNIVLFQKFALTKDISNNIVKNLTLG